MQNFHPTDEYGQLGAANYSIDETEEWLPWDKAVNCYVWDTDSLSWARMTQPATQGSGTVSLTIKEEGTTLTTAATSINFVGTAIEATVPPGGSAVTVTTYALTTSDVSVIGRTGVLSSAIGTLSSAQLPALTSAMISGLGPSAFSAMDITTIATDTREPTGFLDTVLWGLATVSVVSTTKLKLSVPTTSGTISRYWKGIKTTVSSPIEITSTADKAEGIWYAYTTDGTNWVLSQTSFSILTDMMLYEFYWDNTNNVALWLQPEYHGCIQDAETHYQKHEEFGTRYVNGVAATGYTLNSANNADTRIKLSSGEIHDEDIHAYINHSATPAARWEQILGSAGTADSNFATLPIYYRNGADGSNLWAKQTATSYPFSPASNTLMYYNRLNAGTWDYTTSAATTGRVNMWVVATTNQSEPIVLIPGRASHSTLAAAQAEAFPSLIGLFTEYKLLYRLLYQTITGNTNNGKASLIQVDDYRKDVLYNNAGVTANLSAAQVTFTPTGNVSATNVQAAIEELDTEKAPLASPSFTGAIKEQLNAFTSSGNITIDLANGTTQRIVLDAARQITMPSSPGAYGQGFTLIIDCAGYTPTWNASPTIKWLTSDNNAPTLNTTSTKSNVMTFIWENANTRWLGFLAGKEL